MNITKGMRLFLLGLLVLSTTACSLEKEDGNQKEKLIDVTVVLDWTPNTNHTGLYVARDKGYYEEAGLNVEIVPMVEGSSQMIATGKIDFGISGQESVTEARKNDVPLVSIAAIIQHNTSGFASPESKGIKTPKDFEGRKYGGWGAPFEKPMLDSMMKKEGADVEKVEFLSIGEADYFTAVKRDIDFAWIFYGWTGIQAELRNEKTNMIYLNQFSEQLDYYTPLLITSEQLIDDQPDVVKSFMAATSKGYIEAIQNPEKAAEILIKAEPDIDKELIMASQKWLSPRYQAEAAQWGIQKKEVWQNYADWMTQYGLLEKMIDVDKAFTNEFLPKK